jgi:hypothetical protein
MGPAPFLEEEILLTHNAEIQMPSCSIKDDEQTDAADAYAHLMSFHNGHPTLRASRRCDANAASSFAGECS